MSDLQWAAVNDALQLAVQRARAEVEGAPNELTGTVADLNAFGVGIHGVVIDGDTVGTTVPAHSITSTPLQGGSRVALLAVQPHQVWIIGEINRTTSACRVWANADTAFPALNTNVVVNMGQVSYDLADNYDLSTNEFTVRQAGLYEVQHRLIVPGCIEGDRFRSEVWELEATARRSRGSDDEAGTSQSVTCLGSDTLFFEVGDRVQLQAIQIDGALRSITGDVESQTWFCVRRI